MDWHEARHLFAETGRARPTGAERVALADAVGRTAAQPVIAPRPVPGFDSSAMDGWVVCGDGPWVIGAEIRIGDAPDRGPLHPGTARPIATGAPVPPGPVAVLRREHGDVRGGSLHTLPGATDPTAGADVRRTGEEVAAGETVLRAGGRLSPAAVALAAVCGIDTLAVRVPPTVEVRVLGGEIVTAGVPAPGRVRDAYGPQLPALLSTLGAAPRAVHPLEDDVDAIAAAVAGSDADVVLTTGGSSLGPTDRLRAALRVAGCGLAVDGVAMRPGHPVLLARRPDGRPVVGLPGNPFAGMVALLTLGIPLLDGMLGRPAARLAVQAAAADLPNGRPGMRIVACRLTEEGVTPVDFQGPAMLRGLVEADLLAVVPEGGVRRHEQVPVLALPW